MDKAIYNYEGKEVSFLITGKDEIMINSTEMSKIFDKNVKTYFENISTT